MNSSMPTCDFVACTESATGQYLSLEQDRAVEFRVCPAHFARIEGGERPKIVAQRMGLAELDGPPALLLD
jgi:hypothetical protein